MTRKPKICISGDFTRSAFQELHGFDAVARPVRERFPSHHLHLHRDPMPIEDAERAGKLPSDA